MFEDDDEPVEGKAAAATGWEGGISLGNVPNSFPASSSKLVSATLNEVAC